VFIPFCSVLCSLKFACLRMNIRGPFAKFVDSPYYSESELCGGAVTVSLSKYSLGKRFTSYNAPSTCPKRDADADHFEISCLRSSLFVVGKAQKSHGARSELNFVFGLEKVDRWNSIRTSAIQSRSLSLSHTHTHKRVLRRAHTVHFLSYLPL